MIGVIARPGQTAVVEEFFELFKTPWEFYRPGRVYEVVVATADQIPQPTPKFFISYGATRKNADGRSLVPDQSHPSGIVVQQGGPVPVYAGLLSFKAVAPETVCLTADVGAVGIRCGIGEANVMRVGYDLFEEVRFLLLTGQPVGNAHIPTLDLHIAMLRNWILAAGIPIVEIPPSPAGYRFAVCLTHDIDFVGVRRLGWGRTLFGFVARASVGTLADVIRGRRRLGEAAQNWLALLSLPLVRLGLLPDFWQPFHDYRRVEHSTRSTFFLVPFKGRPGVAPDGIVDQRRGVSYEMSEIGEIAAEAAALGSELAVHGIDAWRDAAAGRNELMQVASITDADCAGIRMHWLYFDAESPRRLESAGFAYDSTWGYNEAVGYRAGTSQVFRLSGTDRLMELPLAIMDSALFAGARMRLSHDTALGVCRTIINNAKRFGGTVVVNWHCRSLAPERLWGRFYQALLDEIGTDQVWFATAREVVDWFRWRRSIRFVTDVETGEKARVAAAYPTDRPGVIRVHRPGPIGTQVQDVPFDGRWAATPTVARQFNPLSIA